MSTNPTPQTAIPTVWRSLALAGLFGLMLLIVIWNAWIVPNSVVPLWLELLILLLPLLMLAPGIWRNSGRSYVLSILFSLLYATLGVWFVAGLPNEQKYGWGLLILSGAWYAGSFMCARVISRYNKAQALQEANE